MKKCEEGGECIKSHLEAVETHVMWIASDLHNHIYKFSEGRAYTLYSFHCHNIWVNIMRSPLAGGTSTVLYRRTISVYFHSHSGLNLPLF